MNREAEKTVKVLNRFNKPRESLKDCTKLYAYYEAIVKTDGVLYATDGHILCMVKDTEDILKEGTVCYDVKSKLDHEADVEILKALMNKGSYQKIAEDSRSYTRCKFYNRLGQGSADSFKAFC